MKPLGELLGETFSDAQYERLRGQQALHRWDEIVGPQVANAARPYVIRGDALHVVTRTAAWANELTLLKPQILQKLNEAIGSSEIQDIVFRAGRMPVDNSPKVKRAESHAAPDHRQERLTRPEREWVEALMQKCEDERLQRAVRLCAEETIRLRRSRRRKDWRECRVCRRQNPPEEEKCTGCGRLLVLQSTAP